MMLPLTSHLLPMISGAVVRQEEMEVCSVYPSPPPPCLSFSSTSMFILLPHLHVYPSPPRPCCYYYYNTCRWRREGEIKSGFVKRGGVEQMCWNLCAHPLSRGWVGGGIKPKVWQAPSPFLLPSPPPCQKTQP